MALDVDAVVVDHDSGTLLKRCVESLIDAGAAKVVVVDNAVPSGSSAAVLGTRANVEIVATGHNVGYGAGANRGVAACESEMVLICNPDVIVEKGSLATLAGALENDRGLAVVGPRVNEPDGTRYPSARKFPSLIEGAGHALGGLLSKENRFTRRYRMEDLDSGASESAASDDATALIVDWVSGSCFMARRQAFEELGGFDESYFMYGEDVDLGWRAHQAGWQVAFAPAAVVTHLGAMSTRRAPYRMLVAHHRSALRFAGRSLEGPKRATLPAVAAAFGARLTFEVARQALTSESGVQSWADPTDRTKALVSDG